MGDISDLALLAAQRGQRIAELEAQLAQVQHERDRLAYQVQILFEECEIRSRRAEAAEAQVAALVPRHSYRCASMIGKGNDGTAERMDCDCERGRIIASLPAAAEKLLAAQKACESIDAWIGQKKPGDYGVAQDVDCELEDWRKAGGSG